MKLFQFWSILYMSRNPRKITNWLSSEWKDYILHICCDLQIASSLALKSFQWFQVKFLSSLVCQFCLLGSNFNLNLNASCHHYISCKIGKINHCCVEKTCPWQQSHFAVKCPAFDNSGSIRFECLFFDYDQSALWSGEGEICRISVDLTWHFFCWINLSQNSFYLQTVLFIFNSAHDYLKIQFGNTKKLVFFPLKCAQSKLGIFVQNLDWLTVCTEKIGICSSFRVNQSLSLLFQVIVNWDFASQNGEHFMKVCREFDSF